MKRILLLATPLLVGLTASGQTPFQNLDFEAATFPGAPPDPTYGRYDISNAMPGWTAYVGTRPENLILHNNFFLSSAGIGILDSACVNPLPGTDWCQVLTGQYTAWLQAGYDFPGFGGGWQNVSIAQTGLIPDGSRTMTFLSAGAGGLDPAPYLQVSVAGLVTPLYLLGTSPSFNAYGVDVSAYAGQATDIQFTVSGQLYLDLIRFTATPVPEPSALGLIGMAGAALASLGVWNRHRRRRSQ